MHLSRLTILNSVSPEHCCSKFPAKLSLVFKMLHKYLQYISWCVNILYLEVMYLVLLHISVLNAPLWHLIQSFLSKYTLSAPNFDLLEVAPMSLCTVDLIHSRRWLDLIDSMVNSKTEGAGVFKIITVLTLVISMSQMHLSRLTTLNSISLAHCCSTSPAKLSLVFGILHKYLQHNSWKVIFLYPEACNLRCVVAY